MKCLKTALAALIAIAMLSCPALGIDLSPGTGDDFYVQDNANVLSYSTQELIAGYNAALETQCHEAQLVVVTVNYLDEDTQVASLQLLNDWGVGSESESNGMLLLLVANEHRGWLSTGDGIDMAFDDDVTDAYLEDYFWDYIDNDEFDDGVQTLASALYDWYLDYYDVDTGIYGGDIDYDYNSGYYPPPEYERGVDFMGIVSLIILVAVIWAIVSAGRYSHMRGWGYRGGFWPIFWFGGSRMYHDWHHRHHDHRPPRGPGGFGGPGPGPGPGGPGGGRPGPGPGAPRSSGSRRPNGGGRPTGFGGFPGNGSGGFGGGFGGHSGGFGGGHGGGFGGHGGGGGAGRH